MSNNDRYAPVFRGGTLSNRAGGGGATPVPVERRNFGHRRVANRAPQPDPIPVHVDGQQRLLSHPTGTVIFLCVMLIVVLILVLILVDRIAVLEQKVDALIRKSHLDAKYLV